jgi:hypothetical protein
MMVTRGPAILRHDSMTPICGSDGRFAKDHPQGDAQVAKQAKSERLIR